MTTELRTLYFVRLVIFFSSWPGFSIQKFGPPIQLSLIFAFLAYLVDVPRCLLTGGAHRFFATRDFIFLFLFLIVVSLSLLKVDPGVYYAGKSSFSAYLRQLFSLTAGLSIFILTFLSVRSWDDVMCAIRTFIVGAIAPFIFGFLELLNSLLEGRLNDILGFLVSRSGEYSASYAHDISLFRVRLITPESSYGSIYAQMLIAICLGAFLFKQRPDKKLEIKKWFSRLSIMFTVLTFAKTLVFTTASLALTLIYFKRVAVDDLKKRIQYFFGRSIGPVLVGITAILAVLSYRMYLVFSGKSIPDMSTWTRFHNLMVGLNMAYENPLLGVGWGNFGHQYGLYQLESLSNFTMNQELFESFADRGNTESLSAQNLYVHVAAEIGFLGMMFFILFLVRPLARVIRYSAQSDQSNNAMLAGMVVFGYIVALSGNLTCVNLNIYYFWIFCALLYSINSLVQPPVTLQK